MSMFLLSGILAFLAAARCSRYYPRAAKWLAIVNIASVLLYFCGTPAAVEFAASPVTSCAYANDDKPQVDRRSDRPAVRSLERVTRR